MPVERRTPLSIQRQAANTGTPPPVETPAAPSSAPDGSTTPSAPATETAPPEPVSQAASPATEPTHGSLIVEDEAEPASGQMRKSEFLAALKDAVCRTAEESLAGTMWSAAGCPWIDHWFNYYADRDSAQIERSIRRYAPESAAVQGAAGYILLVAARVRRAIQEWSGTGRLPQIPSEFAMPAATPAAVPPAVNLKAQPAGDAGPAVSPAAVRSDLGPGVPLDSVVRTRLGAAVAQDLSNVRVHTDYTGAALSQKLNARAFAVGEHVAFAAGEYRPGTLAGDALIAHELAHVAQQQDSRATARPARTSDIEAEADAAAAGAIAGLWGGGRMARARTPGLRSGLRLSRCGRPAEEQIPFGKTKQQYWREQFKQKYPQLENIGQVAGPRDEGVMTETGIRVPLHKGGLLLPRRFYEVKDAEFAVYQGYIHYAELIEAGHGGQAVDLSEKYGAPFIPDNKLDMDGVVGWSRNAELARRGVETFVAAGETAQTYRDLAAERAAARAAAKPKDVPVPKKESVIVQGETTDPIVTKSTAEMAKRTGQRVVTLGKGTLEGVDEVTVIAHGHESLVKIGDQTLTPEDSRRRSRTPVLRAARFAWQRVRARVATR